VKVALARIGGWHLVLPVTLPTEGVARPTLRVVADGSHVTSGLRVHSCSPGESMSHPRAGAQARGQAGGVSCRR
jgi:hypothetical protein